MFRIRPRALLKAALLPTALLMAARCLPIAMSGGAVVRKPQVIEDQEHERVFERVAAVDVAKAPGMVCTRTPNPSRPGARHSTVWEVPATMNAVLALAARLLEDGIEMVMLESTADYWRIWYYVLESAGLAVQLVPASQARNLPGRPKTDRLDAIGHCPFHLTWPGMRGARRRVLTAHSHPWAGRAWPA